MQSSEDSKSIWLWNQRIKEKRIKRNEDKLRDLQENIKRYNIRIIGVPEEEDKKKDRMEVFIVQQPHIEKNVKNQMHSKNRIFIHTIGM